MLGPNTNSTALTVLALTLACSPTPAWCAAENADEDGRIVFAFDRQAGDLPWRVINDGVMGGLSRGDASLSDESTLVFSGVLSLENRGGFSSIWSPPAVDDLGDSDVLVLRVRGDGRDYYVNLKNRGDSAAGSHRLLIRTQSDQWQIVSLPFDDFKYTRFGQQTPGSTPLDSSQIRQFGFTISDKKPGPFRLEVDWIKATTAQSGSVALNERATKDIIETAKAAGNFGTLLAALDAAELTDSLRADGPLTVLAPTDEAFAKVPKQALADLLRPENKDKLVAVLSLHVLPGSFPLRMRELKAASGSPLAIEATGDLTVGNATVIQADVVASNGLIQVLDTVLTQDEGATSSVAGARQIIADAIKRGVPLFNAGSKSECAGTYERAAETVLASHGRALPQKERVRLGVALRRIRKEDDAGRRAWILRYALDAVDRGLRRQAGVDVK